MSDEEQLLPITMAAVTGGAVLVMMMSTLWLWRESSSSSSLSSLKKDTTSSKAIPPPMARGWPLVGSSLEFSADCRAFLRRHFLKFDVPIFSAPLAGTTFHFINTASSITAVDRLFRLPQLDFLPVANQAVEKGFGLDKTNVLVSNGMKQDGKEANRIFHKHLLVSVGLPQLVSNVQRALAQSAFPRYLSATSQECTTLRPLYELVSKILFRATVEAVVSPTLVTGNDDDESSWRNFQTFDQKFPLLVAGLPPFLFRDAVQARQELAKACGTTEFQNNCSELIQDRIQLFQQLGMDANAVAVLNSVVIWAAVANTTPAGFWCLYHLLACPAAYRAVQKEVDALGKQNRSAADADTDDTAVEEWTLDELQRMTLLDSALTEALRLYSESLIARDVLEDFDLDLQVDGLPKFCLKKGSRVAIMMSFLHYDETVFENPTQFQYDRFAQNKKFVQANNGQRLSNPVRPFGGGSSMCPGRKLAYYELKSFLASLLLQYDLELVDSDQKAPGIDPSRVGLGIHVPLHDVNVRLKKRQN